MDYCLRCASTIQETSQYYYTDDLGPEIISVLERNLNHEIDHNGVVCSQCFSNILQELSITVPQRTGHSSSSRSKEHGLQLSHDSNVCVWCLNSLFKRRTQTIPAEGPARNFISDRISPREIPENGMVCYACWYRAQRTLKQQGVVCPPTVNLNACVRCHRSLARARRHSLPRGPERDEIIAKIYPREIPPGGLVCYGCWVAARRNVQRAQNVEQEHSSSTHYGAICAWCEVSIYRRQTHILSHGPERDEVVTRIYPRELPEHALLCLNCWTRAQENIAIYEGNLIQPVSTLNENVTLDEFVHTTNSSGHCFVPSCGNPERNRVPNYLRKLILKTQKIFVTDNARICNEHKTFYNWEFLEHQHFSNTFNKDEVQSMLRLSIQDTKMILDYDIKL